MDERIEVARWLEVLRAAANMADWIIESYAALDYRGAVFPAGGRELFVEHLRNPILHAAGACHLETDTPLANQIFKVITATEKLESNSNSFENDLARLINVVNITRDELIAFEQGRTG